jgi:signal peptidase I
MFIPLNSEIDLSKSPVFDLWKEAGRMIDVKVEGNSMRPLMRPGDTVSLRLTDGSEFKTGDLIAYKQDGKLIVHRFVKQRNIDKSLWLCQKGDNLSDWSWISEGEALGRVEAIRGRGKQIDINTRLWTRINRVMGISGLLWVSAMEKARLFKECVAPDRQLPVLGWLVSRAGNVLNSTCGLIIIKAFSAGDRKA